MLCPADSYRRKLASKVHDESQITVKCVIESADRKNRSRHRLSAGMQNLTPYARAGGQSMGDKHHHD